MFSKYYIFIQSKLSTIGYLGKDTTISNYFKAVIGGFLLLLSFIAAIAVTILLLGMPIILYFYFIINPYKKMNSERMNFIDESNRELNEEKERLMNKNHVEYYFDLPENDEYKEINKKQDKIDEEISQTCKEMKIKENKIIKRNLIKVILVLLFYTPAVIPLLFILLDITWDIGKGASTLLLFFMFFYVVASIIIFICNLISILEESPTNEYKYNINLDFPIIYLISTSISILLLVWII